MQFKNILRLIGMLLMIFSISMLSPIIVNIIYQESFWLPFFYAFSCTITTGLCLAIIFRKHKHELKTRDGFLIVVLFWFVLCAFASLPFIFTVDSHTMTDAFFESVSGFTTTGATVINNLDKLPHAILFYRQQLQFLGGMGIVVLAVAILPMLGVGGMQLYQAEATGPMKDNKLTPRIAETAKSLWIIYVAITIACMLCYRLAGMNWFDAIGESFSTVSTGGFSTHDLSFAHYQSTAVLLICCVFMLLGAINFGLHFKFFAKKTVRQYWLDEECRLYILFLFFAILLIAASLVLYGFFDTKSSIINSLFTVISLSTTTGFTATPFASWPTFIPILLTFIAIIGGSAASTSGGVKVVRALMLFKQGRKELILLVHPNAVIPLKFGRQNCPLSVVQSIWAFISVFTVLYIILMLMLMGFGNDFVTSFSAVTASLANAGAGIGKVSVTYAKLSTSSKWLLMFAMIAGRLEIFSLLILFTKQFWQK